MKPKTNENITYRNINLKRKLKQNECESNNIYRFNALFEELNSNKADKTTNTNSLLVQPDHNSKNFRQSKKTKKKFHLRNKSNSELSNYNTKKMSTLFKPSFFHYYLYDKKQSLSMVNNLYSNQSTSALLSPKHLNNVKIIKKSLSQQKKLVTLLRKKTNSSLIKTRKNNGENLAVGHIHSIDKNNKKFETNSFEVNKLKSKDSYFKSDEDNDKNSELILQSVTINHVEFQSSNNCSSNISKINDNSSYNDYIFGAIEKKKPQKNSLNEKLLKNKMIRCNITFKAFHLATNQFLPSLRHRWIKPQLGFRDRIKSNSKIF